MQLPKGHGKTFFLETVLHYLAIAFTSSRNTFLFPRDTFLLLFLLRQLIMGIVTWLKSKFDLAHDPFPPSGIYHDYPRDQGDVHKRTA